MIKTFANFMAESNSHSDTAGVAIVMDGKILLVHPTNGSWAKPIMGIPKGRIEQGEEIMDAAIRELHEETGIAVSPNQLDPRIQTVEVFDKNGKYRNSIHYYLCKISDPSEIGLSGLSVPKEQLQKEEVDWAGFVDVKQAYAKVTRSQLLILDRLS